MTSWGDFERSEPAFAARVRRLLDAGRHKTIATLRADGSPRISGTECAIEAGELRFGSGTSARKAVDLRRDPRFALHGPTVDPETGREADWPGEVKITGRAKTVPAEAGEADADADADADAVSTFAADITEVVHTHLDPDATKLIVEWWTPEGGLQYAEPA